MPVERTAIEGLLVVRWEPHHDERGFLQQTYQVGELAAALGREPVLRQGNHSRSRPGVLRGFHAEPWDKLVYVARGTAFCAAADLRADSPTFATAETFTLGDAPGQRVRLFVAAGLANAFCALTETDYLYDVSAEWEPGAERRTVVWDDPDLDVPWPLSDPVLSDTDRASPTLRQLEPGHPRWR